MNTISCLLTTVVNRFHGYPATWIPTETDITEYIKHDPNFMVIRMQVFTSWILCNKRVTPYGLKMKYGTLTITPRNILCEYFYDFRYIVFIENVDYSGEVMLFKEAYEELGLDANAFIAPQEVYRGEIAAERFNDLVRMIRKKSRLKRHSYVYTRHQLQ